MASLRSPSSSRSRAEALQTGKKDHAESSKEQRVPTSLPILRRETDNSLDKRLGIPSQRSQSRIPQTNPSRKFSHPPPKPPLTHETRSWSSASPMRPLTATAGSNLPSVRDRDLGTNEPRNVLRRKQSIISKETNMIRSRLPSSRSSSASSVSGSVSQGANSNSLDRQITASPVEIQGGHAVNVVPESLYRMTGIVYPELDRYRDIEIPHSGPESEILFRLATHDLPPPTPLFSSGSSHSQMSTFSGSPSTRFSGSPGPGPYSRDTTPTSISSASPGLIVPIRSHGSRAKQASPAESRPPVARRRAMSNAEDGEPMTGDDRGLPAVRETLTSSSSSSTVREGERGNEKAKTKKKGLWQEPPNPPPRKSSERAGYRQNEVLSRDRPELGESALGSVSPIRRMERNNSASSMLQGRMKPPRRPSRDGAPNLNSQAGGPLPIIHSNLSSTSISDRRKSNQLTPGTTPTFSHPIYSSTHSSAEKLPGREATPTPNNVSTSSVETGKSLTSTRSPSPGPSGFRARFGLFGKRTKSDADATRSADKKAKDRPLRKGPAAGTGHEGYGRVGAIKRRSANNPRAPTGPVSSSDSLGSMQSADQFFLDRINPVVIVGGEVVENRNTSSELSRVESELSLRAPRPSIESRNTSSVSLSSRDDNRNTLWPSVFPRESSNTRRPSDSSGSEVMNMKPTIAFRRSVQRLRASPELEPMRVPKPILVKGFKSPSVGSEGMITSDDTSAPPHQRPEEPKEAKKTPNKLSKRIMSPRKWNIFGKLQSPAKTEVRRPSDVAVAAAVKPIDTKPVAFYTMMSDFDETEHVKSSDFAVTQTGRKPSHPSEAASGAGRRLSSTNRLSQSEALEVLSKQAIVPIHVQSPPPEKPSTSEETDLAHSTAPMRSEKPSRLPQIGRIPKVVRTRPEQVSPKSFSRPFNRVSFQLPHSPAAHVRSDSVARGVSSPQSATPELVRDESTVVVGSDHSMSLFRNPFIPQESAANNDYLDPEFLRLSRRKNSECTITSSRSSGSGMAIYTQQTTAVVPEASAPLAEDEVWDEFNDLLYDHAHSGTLSKKLPARLDIFPSGLSVNIGKALESPTIRFRPAPDLYIPGSYDTVEPEKSTPASSHFSADMTARINTAFRFGTEASPATPFSVTDFVSGYGERNLSSVDISQSPVPAQAQAPVPVQRNSASSKRSSKTSSKTRTSTSSASSEETPLSQVNLRVGSMTVSKWLTFGQVLFSPVREDILPSVGSLKRHSILVIDGLGNDDWSFYAAETFPAATFFNLSPRAPLSQEHRASPSFPLSPPNHHQIQYASHLDKFPFGEDSFTAVVFRFPAAAPEPHCRNIIAEARRVLKPGGYIELSILDADLNNMGPRTRRAVRRFRENVTLQHPELNLSSTADLMLRLLGQNNFVDLKTCKVGIPAASVVATASSSAATEKGTKRKKDERSLAEMMNDETETGDENIAKMVAKVGRWWFHRLYEIPTNTTKSLWNDRSLLTECEDWGTSFKLSVCYARLPESRGRVSSV